MVRKKKSFGTNVISVKGLNTVEPFVFYKILLRETAHLHSLLSKEGITLPRFPEKALEKKKAGPGQGRPARKSRNWDTNPFIPTLKFVCFPEARAATETHQVSVLFREPHVEDVLCSTVSSRLLRGHLTSHMGSWGIFLSKFGEPSPWV